jgi:hypothetical protein
MNIDTPDNNPQRPEHNPDGPAVPKELASDIIPKGSSLPKEVLDLLAAWGIDVSPKGLPYVFLGTQHERFHLGSIANMRVTEHKGHPALIFHYKETETSDWETVVIVYVDLTKYQVYLLALAISSGRVQAVVFGDAIVSIMEGGSEAFQRRKEIYQIWKHQNS